eukprot:TRINITY_DN80729_c0_g1_i1.p1 TRINITY_DN80729_c0_g1~~TRINITY_DN80729_c0_g1_i1.p1  ORF type:complete len:175 (+),score=24.10 TRINITY_DN80729_c0_g1_i1:61-585(+)
MSGRGTPSRGGAFTPYSEGGFRTPSIRETGRRAASTGRSWYRGVTPHVNSQDRHDTGSWRRAYDQRFMTTSMNTMQEHTGACVEAARQMHAEKLDYFRPHQFPNVTWMDLTTLTHERSVKQRQPAYYGDVGGPRREGINNRLQAVPLGDKVLMPSMNLCCKSSRFWGIPSIRKE